MRLPKESDCPALVFPEKLVPKARTPQSLLTNGNGTVRDKHKHIITLRNNPLLVSKL